MYLLKRLCDMTLGEVAREFGVKSYVTVGWACHGIRLKCDVNSKYRRQIENLETTSTKDLTPSDPIRFLGHVVAAFRLDDSEFRGGKNQEAFPGSEIIHFPLLFSGLLTLSALRRLFWFESYLFQLLFFIRDNDKGAFEKLSVSTLPVST